MSHKKVIFLFTLLIVQFQGVAGVSSELTGGIDN
jgi:hypothetical protein